MLKRYEQVYLKGDHFSFGKNWSDFIERKMSNDVIKEAENSISSFLGKDINLRNQSFIDVGSGSGLFSLAAVRLGAKPVVSIDADKWSVECTESVRSRYAPLAEWSVKQASILDNEAVDKLGQFDVVYSWGVLHHTGDMWRAISTTSRMVRSDGLFYLAIYNTSHSWVEGTSSAWTFIKRHYNSVGKMRKAIYRWLYIGYMVCGLMVHGINPWRYISEYRSLRGMDFFTDIADWLGGDPYEHADVKEVIEYLKSLGFYLVRLKRARNIGCNEYLFKRGPLDR